VKSAAILAPEPFLREQAAPVTHMRLSLDAARFGREHTEAPEVHLTPRQLEVLTLLCEGLPNKLICRQLNISTGTVKVHISGILRELGVTSRLQAVVSARRRGLLDGALPGRAEGAFLQEGVF
jgi:DNA-binding NarL/FixJ family response regulator